MISLNASAVTAVLNEGMTVGVRLGSATSWHGNIVYGVKGSTIYVAYMDKFMKDLAAPGCSASIKYSNDYFIYHFSGVVKNIHIIDPAYVSIEISGAEEMVNNRLFPRYDVKLAATLRPSWDDEVYPCTVTDLSYGGAAFSCLQKFDINERLEMTIHIPDGAVAKITARVVRRKSRLGAETDYSIQFTDCDDTGGKLLSAYFSILEEEASEIYRYFVTEVKGRSFESV